MASLEVQEKYMVHATAKEYLRADEVVELLMECCREMDATEFSEEELKLGKLIADKILDMDWCRVNTQSYDELVHHNEEWIEVRSLSLRLINLFGYTLDDFHEDEDGFVVPPQG